MDRSSGSGSYWVFSATTFEGIWLYIWMASASSRSTLLILASVVYTVFVVVLADEPRCKESCGRFKPGSKIVSHMTSLWLDAFSISFWATWELLSESFVLKESNATWLSLCDLIAGTHDQSSVMISSTASQVWTVDLPASWETAGVQQNFGVGKWPAHKKPQASQKSLRCCQNWKETKHLLLP